MNNVRQMFRVYNDLGDYFTISEDPDELGLIEISDDEGMPLLTLSLEMAQDFRDCLDELIGKIGRRSRDEEEQLEVIE